MQEHEVELHGLHQTVLNKISTFPKGNILDVGAGKGEFAQKLVAIGYDVEACDITPEPPWSRRLGVTYSQCDLNLGGLPFGDESFDYVVCIEVIEHIENPFALCRELKRVLKHGGRAILSTPNILRFRSRIQFFLEGNYPWFDLPLIEWEQQGGGAYVHINPMRVHEMEYCLYKAGFEVEEFFANKRSYRGWPVLPLELAIRFFLWLKVKKSRRHGGPSVSRLYSLILTKDLLYGTHLIVCAKRP